MEPFQLAFKINHLVIFCCEMMLLSNKKALAERKSPQVLSARNVFDDIKGYRPVQTGDNRNYSV